MKTANQILGKNLQMIRALSGFTQEQVASAVGIERSAYSNYEGGIREVPYTVVEEISNLFGCEPLLLFDDNANNELLITAFRISDLSTSDLREIANFKDIVKAYLKMERIASND